MAVKSDLLRKIEKGAGEPTVVKDDDSEAFSDEKAYLERRRTEVEIEGQSQNIKERKRYALCFFTLACGWVLIISALLFFEGFGRTLGFQLSDHVLLVAIGSTTANILGILYVVANYLFKKT